MLRKKDKSESSTQHLLCSCDRRGSAHPRQWERRCKLLPRELHSASRRPHFEPYPRTSVLDLNLFCASVSKVAPEAIASCFVAFQPVKGFLGMLCFQLVAKPVFDLPVHSNTNWLHLFLKWPLQSMFISVSITMIIEGQFGWKQNPWLTYFYP